MDVLQWAQRWLHVIERNPHGDDIGRHKVEVGAISVEGERACAGRLSRSQDERKSVRAAMGAAVRFESPLPHLGPDLVVGHACTSGPAAQGCDGLPELR